ncbi:unnamed protein product [Ectocarpus sp. CCAP 1310/34]|nr:unnamed protein product [Ectocarpus sp. CCAP 1310/34]
MKLGRCVDLEDGRAEDVVELLVSNEGKGTDDFQGGGKTALMLTAREGHKSVVCELLNHGAEINKNGEKCGQTALQFAAGCGHNNVVGFLVERGADLESPHSRLKGALQLAAEGGHLRVVNALVLGGATVSCGYVGRLLYGVEEGFGATLDNLLGGGKVGGAVV